MASGANCKALWGIELTAGGAANFGQGAAAVNKPFGYNQDIAPSVERNIDRRYNLGSRAAARYSHGMFVGNLPISCDLTTPFLLELLFGSYTKTGDDPYTYTFEETDTLPSAEVQLAETLDDGVLFRQLLGCVAKSGSISIDANSNEPIRLSLDMAFASERRSNAVPAAFDSAWTAGGVDTIEPFMFGHARWYAWTGSAYAPIADTDTVDIKIDHGTELKPSLGSEFPTRASHGMRKWDISTVTKFNRASPYLDALYGAALSATPTAPGAPKYVGATDGSKGLKLEIVAAGTTPLTYTFEFSQCIVTQHSNPVKGPDDELMESVELMASACSLVVTNAPAEPARK